MEDCSPDDRVGHEYIWQIPSDDEEKACGKMYSMKMSNVRKNT